MNWWVVIAGLAYIGAGWSAGLRGICGDVLILLPRQCLHSYGGVQEMKALNLDDCFYSWWEILLARIFGTKGVVEDCDGSTVTFYKFRRRTYVTDIKVKFNGRNF